MQSLQTYPRAEAWQRKISKQNTMLMFFFFRFLFLNNASLDRVHLITISAVLSSNPQHFLTVPSAIAQFSIWKNNSVHVPFEIHASQANGTVQYTRRCKLVKYRPFLQIISFSVHGIMLTHIPCKNFIMCLSINTLFNHTHVDVLKRVRPSINVSKALSVKAKLRPKTKHPHCSTYDADAGQSTLRVYSKHSCVLHNTYSQRRHACKVFCLSACQKWRQ